MGYEKELSDILKRLSQMKSVSAIFIFGSYCSGRMREDSDIDIAVLVKKANEKEKFNILGEGGGRFDISIFERLPLIIQFRVLKEGKLVFCKDEKYLHDVKFKILREYLDYALFANQFYRRVMRDV
jgi:predicted nucleotidyltransferase